MNWAVLYIHIHNTVVGLALVVASRKMLPERAATVVRKRGAVGGEG